MLYVMKTLIALSSMKAAFSSGTVDSADIHLSGEVEQFNEFKLACFSCCKPYAGSVHFYVDAVQVDTIRFSDGECYHKRKLCNPKECTCSMEENNFTLSINSSLSYIEFSCEMRFLDKAKSTLSIQTAYLIFNETEFIPKLNEKTHIKVGTKNSSRIDSANGEETCPGCLWQNICVGVLSAVIGVIVIIVVVKSKQKWQCTNMKKKEENNVNDEHGTMIDDDMNIS